MMALLQAVSLFYIFIWRANYPWHIFLNELGVITIGIGVALLINLYMPSVDKKLKDYQLRN